MTDQNSVQNNYLRTEAVVLNSVRNSVNYKDVNDKLSCIVYQYLLVSDKLSICTL